MKKTPEDSNFGFLLISFKNFFLKCAVPGKKYEAKLEIPGGLGGFKPKNHPWGRYGYFFGTTQLFDLLNSGCGLSASTA